MTAVNMPPGSFVAEGCVKNYLKKDKRKKERLAKKSTEASKTYHEYDWNVQRCMVLLVGRQKQFLIST